MPCKRCMNTAEPPHIEQVLVPSLTAASEFFHDFVECDDNVQRQSLLHYTVSFKVYTQHNMLFFSFFKTLVDQEVRICDNY